MVTAHKIIKSPNLTLALNWQKCIEISRLSTNRTRRDIQPAGYKGGKKHTHTNWLVLEVWGTEKNGEQVKQQKRKTNTDLCQMDHQWHKM